MFISERNPTSGRSVGFADEGPAIWMYLTAPDTGDIIADCWVCNLIPVPDNLNDYAKSRSAPPAIKPFIHPEALQPLPTKSQIQFIWSTDGESVAVMISNTLFGFIVTGSKRGYSRLLVKPGPFGNPLDLDLFDLIFSSRDAT